MKSRGIRRQTDRSKKLKFRRIMHDRQLSRFLGPNIPKQDINEIDSRLVGKCAASPKQCSCALCGNRRKLSKGKDKLTLQELREKRKEDDDIKATFNES